MHAGARRQEREHGVRRRRPRRGRASAPYAVFDNAGQDCCARSRILVQRSVYDEFLDLLQQAVRPWSSPTRADEAAEMGPLISAGQRQRVQGYLDEVDVASPATRPTARASGSRRRWCWPTRRSSGSGGRRSSGRWSRCCRSPTRPRRCALANDTEYGLSGSIFTRDLGRALRVSRAVQAGNLSVNSHSSVRYWTPFGGYKQSGLGRELGPDAPDAFTEEKNVFFSDGIGGH